MAECMVEIFNWEFAGKGDHPLCFKMNFQRHRRQSGFNNSNDADESSYNHYSGMFSKPIHTFVGGVVSESVISPVSRFHSIDSLH